MDRANRHVVDERESDREGEAGQGDSHERTPSVVARAFDSHINILHPIRRQRADRGQTRDLTTEAYR
ncbi:hypothetical protein GCM10009845_27160 [Pedococcus bigeumensis]